MDKEKRMVNRFLSPSLVKQSLEYFLKCLWTISSHLRLLSLT